MNGILAKMKQYFVHEIKTNTKVKSYTGHRSYYNHIALQFPKIAVMAIYSLRHINAVRVQQSPYITFHNDTNGCRWKGILIFFPNSLAVQMVKCVTEFVCASLLYQHFGWVTLD